ncbi:MAG: 1-deoxy-D-xylulose-5-phosphate synthase [Syntrophorhabdaceae bacterium]|nr:1-deoxy-D-xylulose-5-phosphate synthase [Syntrophorhabdaceae bacterium]MDD4195907.1 1-deoxy-D-xylulose-5-phosphate synthase [Syntrophorhabdaceae bacterium]
MLLETINSPADLKKLHLSQLIELAAEIRPFITKVISGTGGHLASNLGTVELTIALHYVFDTPHDKIVWDVGHQCYTCKLLTGRRDSFYTIRQDGGLSGFPCKAESPYDIFDTGHASNSISVATGLAESKIKTGSTSKIIAVIGDGSLTGGMAFEALNHAGHLRSDLIVVLNDNEMSISKNVGGLSTHLNRIMTGEFMSNIREELKARMKNMPTIYKTARYLEETVKGIFGPGIFFEELGFTYVGPVDGHNIESLCETFRNVSRLKGPLLVHVITRKGKGYAYAEDDPERFHGISTFELTTGNCLSKGKKTYTDVFGDTIIDLARMDERIVAITAAMGLGTGLDKFSDMFPDRFYDIGIAEQHGVTFSAALALGGLKPFVAIYSTFLQRAYDQVILDVCLQNLPVVFAVDRSGIVGQDGPTHHGVYDLSYFRHIPNMTVMAPRDGNELRQMLYSAHCYNRPCAIRYPRGEALGVPVDCDFKMIEYGTWEQLKEGEDIAIIACGNMVAVAMEAASVLDERGIRAAVVNGRFIKPMDEKLLADVAARSRRIITLEENVVIGGFGSGVSEALCRLQIYMPFKSLGTPDTFIAHGKQDRLRQSLGLDRDGIVRTITDWVKNA